MYEPMKNERVFNVKPVGVKYICESCGVGEMKFVSEESVADVGYLNKHQCTRCGMLVFLKKSYPYIEWIPEEDE